MKKFLCIFAMSALPFTAFAQSDQLINIIGQATGVISQVQGAKASRTSAMDKCTFNASDKNTVLYLADEYNKELFLKNGTTSVLIADAALAQRAAETIRIDCIEKCKDDDACKKKCAPTVNVNATSLLVSSSGLSVIDLNKLSDETSVKLAAQYLLSQWGSVLTPEETAVLSKANANCNFEKTKMWGNVIGQMIKSSGIEGAEGISETLGGLGNSNSPMDLIQGIGSNANVQEMIMNKLIK